MSNAWVQYQTNDSKTTFQTSALSREYQQRRSGFSVIICVIFCEFGSNFQFVLVSIWYLYPYCLACIRDFCESITIAKFNLSIEFQVLENSASLKRCWWIQLAKIKCAKSNFRSWDNNFFRFVCVHASRYFSRVSWTVLRQLILGINLHIVASVGYFYSISSES